MLAGQIKTQELANYAQTEQQRMCRLCQPPRTATLPVRLTRGLLGTCLELDWRLGEG